jgi:hypothetical protein
VSDLEPRVVEGRVISDGVAQSVTREGDRVRVQLTVFGDLAPRLDYAAMASGGPVTIPLPEPVELAAGESLALEIEWRPGLARASHEFTMDRDSVVTTAHAGWPRALEG